jgi:hydroxymethylpyrimidine/phosphomethylpyrimidine kinase
LADIKTFAANGAYGMACITALTVQSTQGVLGVTPVAAHVVHETLDCLAGDVQFAAIKIGMLATGAVAKVVAEFLRSHPEVPVVLDPILQSSSGTALLDTPGQEILQRELLARVAWTTPNLLELAVLTGRSLAQTRDTIEASAQALLAQSQRLGNPGLRVVVTGGHAVPPDDLLLSASQHHWFPGQRIATKATHGTGCTFSSALAARLALGEDDLTSVAAAKAYVSGAMHSAPAIGHGQGPLHHFWQMQRRN